MGIGANWFYSAGLYGPQKGQVGWRGYLSPKSGSPASFLGSPAIYSKKAKRFFFPLFMLVMVLMLFSSIFKVACLRNAIFFFFSLPFCWILVGNFPRIQVVQRDYLNPTLGSPTGLFLEFRSPGRWDYAICWALLCRSLCIGQNGSQTQLLYTSKTAVPSSTTG